MHSQLMFNECIARTRIGPVLRLEKRRQDRRLELRPQIQLTSQQRTRRRKWMTSLCFLRASSSTYLRAPMIPVSSVLSTWSVVVGVEGRNTNREKESFAFFFCGWMEFSIVGAARAGHPAILRRNFSMASLCSNFFAVPVQ